MGLIRHLYQESGLCILARKVCRECERIADEEGHIQAAHKDTTEFASHIFNDLYASGLKDKDKNNWFGEYALPDKDDYSAAAELLQNSFLPEGEKLRLQEQLKRTADARKLLLRNVLPTRPFPKVEDIDCYLEEYYVLLKRIFWNIDSIRDSGLIEKGLIELILNIDTVFEGRGAYASLFAPAVLDGIRHLYSGIDQYDQIIQEVREKEVRSNYREVFVSKILRFFRWNVVHDGDLMQAAVPPCLPSEKVATGLYTEYRQWSLNIPVRSLKDYNSFEGIGELRLLDKILYELDKRIDLYGMEESSISVLIIGDVNETPMKLLCDMLARALRTDSRYRNWASLRIKIQVYTYNEISDTEYISEGKVSHLIRRYNRELLDAKKADALVKQSDIMFILDSCDIYKQDGFQKMVDKDLFWQYIASDTYKANCRAGEQDLVRKGNFTDLMQLFHVLNYRKELGWIKKEVNTTLLRFLDERRSTYSQNDQKKSIYVYVSDIEAFQNMYRDEQQFVRIERYNEKEIAIMRLSDYDEKELPLGKEGDRRIIVFTIWQLIKHIAVRNIEHMIDFFGLEHLEDSYLLREVLIGVDYGRWPENLNFYYYIPEGVFSQDMEERVRQYLEQVILPFFKQHKKDMYFQYFVKSFGSFLYSDAKDVHDMLFLHLFMNQHDLLKQSCLIGKYEYLEDYRPKQCKYSQKRFYGDVMKDYDTSSEVFAFKYRKLDQIQKEGNLPQQEIFQNIINACIENHYKDSFLYLNCCKML